MVPYYGDFPEDATVYLPFNTFSSDDPSASVTITNLADGDIMVHKDGGTTQIATDGATIAINYDGVTGNHLITIDTSVHADYSTGSEYSVRIEGTTVDGATINAWIGSFSIERAGGALAYLKANLGTAGAAATEAGGDGDHLVEAGGDGDHLSAIPWNSAWDAEVQSECADALNAYDPPTKAELDSGFAALNDLSAAEINAELDTALGDYDGPTYDELEGFFQLALRSDAGIETDRSTLLSAINADEGSGAGDYSAQTEAQEALRDHIGDGTNLTEAGGDGDHLTEAGGTGDQFSAIPWNAAWDTEVQSECADALNAYDPPTKAELDAGFAALNDLSAAEVNAEVLDVLNTDTFGEPTGVPGATVTLETKIGYIYMALRNRLDITATKKTFFDNGGAAEWEKDLSDDGTTYSESEGNAI